MISRVNSLKNFNYPAYKSMFPKEKLPHYENINTSPNNKHNIIAMNIDANKAQIQEMSKIIADSEKAEVKEDKKVKVLATAANTEDTKEDEEHNTSDKSTLTTAGSALAKEGLYKYTASKLIKPNPYMVVLSLLGVDFEEDGNALKKGAETGKIGDFKGDYSNYFKNMWNNSDTELKAAWEGLNLPANVISIGLQDCLQTLGVGLSKVLGKEPTVFIGSGVAAVGTAFNAMGDVAADSIQGTVGVFKNLFTGNWGGVGDSATDIYNGVKDSVVDVANSVADVAEDGADVVVAAGEEVADVATDVADEVVDVAEDIGEGISDVADDVGDAIGDAVDEVEDFFDSIF